MKLESAAAARARLQRAALIFWDFDGVIKESVAAKSQGFEQLFLPHGREIARRVRQHHEAHGGISRFEKIPIYLGWAREPVTAARVEEYCGRFSQLVMQAVVDSAWVPGVREYLRSYYNRQEFVLITATPQEEIQSILGELSVAECFRAVYGAPTSKAAAIRDALSVRSCAPEQALAIGDAETDFLAADANGVPFLLRRTELNQPFQSRYDGLAFDDLNHE